MTIRPLAEVPIDSLIASLPKADLHLHQEEVARLDRVVARRQGRPPHNWRASARQLMAETPPGEGAADGAVLVELRFGAGGLALLRPDFMALFRAAERQVQARYPRLRAEAIGFLQLVDDPARLRAAEGQLERCLALADEGLAGLDFSWAFPQQPCWPSPATPSTPRLPRPGDARRSSMKWTNGKLA